MIKEYGSAGFINKGVSDKLTHFLLQMMAIYFNRKHSIRKYLRAVDGWIDFAIGFRTESGSINQGLEFKNGAAKATNGFPLDPKATLIFENEEALVGMLKSSPADIMNMLLKNNLRIEGNLSYMSLFNYFLSIMLGGIQGKISRISFHRTESNINSKDNLKISHERQKANMAQMLCAESIDSGVGFLEDPYLPEYSIEDFPRLESFLDKHFQTKPEICEERPVLLTEWYRENGFERKPDGTVWNPELRQASAFKYLMENKKAMIRKNDLIPGTTTSKEIGVVIYPDTHGTMIWGELNTVKDRTLNPYNISDSAIESLHTNVFPFWSERNVREWVRSKYDSPLCQKIDERFAVYFLWKTAALSHTIPNLKKILKEGTTGIINDIDKRISLLEDNSNQRPVLSAMRITLEGLNSYSSSLSKKAASLARCEEDSARRAELELISQTCLNVPSKPAGTLYEAVCAIWLVWIALHMENTNAGLSIGRLDYILQPYFKKDMSLIFDKADREEYIKAAIELIGCFFLKCTDHLPLVPDIGNYLFGGSSSDQAITIGGVNENGECAVNDMTYILLKVTEILKIRDPNVNARFYPGINSKTYLKRLCEVNLTTKATPSMHNDRSVMASLEKLGYSNEDKRNWAATGCVEPTVCGKHFGHTNCMMLNLVAALEMALNNGHHPLMRWSIGPETGRVEGGFFNSFERFFDAFKKQLEFLIDRAVEYNNMLGEAHEYIRPTPLLSSLIEGCIEQGTDATSGGALYNSSGTACIGLADVTDSLMVIKNLVYDENTISFEDLKKAVERNFVGFEALRAKALNRVPLYGSGSIEAFSIAQEIAKFVSERFHSHENYRGGRYSTGFWSMSNHVAFGTMTGALPSGRLAGKAFTPGLTPEANASKNLLDNIIDVARLNPVYMDNNIAFNVKIVPSTKDTHEHTVNSIMAYVNAYFDMGGMQMQMNVVDSETLKDAMRSPDLHRHLLVRISGYNAYFVTLNRDMQIELIERAEYRV